jgi:uncharacterized damage-inducible protein DinB
MSSELLLQSLVKLYQRDIQRLSDEIKLYKNEADIWKLDGEIKNTGGNLCLHLCGNLQHYIGKNLGGSGYIRNRENEFDLKGLSRAFLLEQLEKTKDAVVKTLPKLTEHQLNSEYPEKVFDYSMTTLHFLLHLLAHLNYHLGQINYHRRMIV